MMNIHFERSGGFAGIRLKHDIDVDALPVKIGEEVRKLIEAAGFFQLPESIKATNPGADRFQYQITMDSGGGKHTVSVDDAAVPETLRPLLRWLTSSAQSR